jgi:lipoprotein-anchoring transpeptidase ErfK/SrfK
MIRVLYMSISRRDFLKLVGGTAGLAALKPFSRVMPLPQFPDSPRLGRLTATLDLVSAPRVDYPSIGKLYPDTVVPWLRETVAQTNDTNVINQRWVETPQGYLYSAYVQPVGNRPNTPLQSLPAGQSGFWAEVTVPYVDFVLENEAPSSPWIKFAKEWNLPTRLYYSQVMWVDQVKVSEVTGNIIYRINERYGSYGDVFWAEGAAFRPLTAEEITPINPNVDPNEKRIVVNLTYQTLSCFESQNEVYFCRVSSGKKWDAQGNVTDTWSTPLGDGHRTWRKIISVHMAGGTVDAGYDTPGVSWDTFFSGSGVAIHSTFWHNNFGTARSHGCVNVLPDDAKWVFRWTTPEVTLELGDITVGMPGGTQVDVKERTF